MNKHTHTFLLIGLFSLFFWIPQLNACHQSGIMGTPTVTDNGNGTYNLTFTWCDAYTSSFGCTSGVRFGVTGANIISFTPSLTATSSPGTVPVMNGVASGTSAVTYGDPTFNCNNGANDWSAFSNLASQNCATITLVLDGSPTTLTSVGTEDNDCTDNLTIAIPSCSLVVNSHPVTAETCAGASDGTLTINATTSAPPLMYSIDGGAFQAGNVFTGLSAGNHTFVVQDANGVFCEESETVTVPAGVVVPTEIFCPANITVDAEAGVCGATVAFNIEVQGCNEITTSIPGYTYLGQFGDNNHYFESTTSSSWTDANAAAIAQGGHLAVVSSQAENDFIFNASGGDVWIGYTDAASEGTFTWANGDPSTFVTWNPGEPNNQGNEDYIEIDGLGNWNDLQNGIQQSHILELEGGLSIQQTAGGLNSNDFFPVGTTELCYQATDANGVQSPVCCFDVTVNDNQPLVANCQDITIELDENGDQIINNIVDYTLNNNDALFAPIAGTGNNVSLLDDEVTGALPIGFNFNFYDNNYTDFYISSNGFITFTGGQGNGCCLGDPVANGANGIENYIAAAWSDLRPPSGGSIDYFTTGTAPNRILVVNYTNVPHYINEGLVTTQIQLNETSNIIEIHTASFISDDSPDRTYTVGIENADGSQGMAQPDFNGNTLPINTPVKTNDYVSFSPSPTINAGSSDNCGIVSEMTSIDISTLGCANVGTINVTLTVVSGSGETDNCVGVVTIEDNIAPECLTQDITIPLNASGNASIIAADVNNGSDDACGIAALAVAPNAFTCANVGNNTVTLTVTDNNGNTSTCTAEVTVEDNIDPNAICTNVTVLLDENGNGDVTVADLDTGSNDACGIATVEITAGQAIYTCADASTNFMVTITATDVNDNTDSQTCQVTVLDQVMPVVNCSNFTAQLDVNGNADIDLTDLQATAMDACNTAALALDNDDFTCADVGPNTVTVTATDVNGNVNICQATVTVQDNEAPECIAQDITIQLNEAGNASILATDIDNGSNDACGIAALSVNPNSFTCANVGNNTVTLVVTDVNTNVSMCTANVLVEDNVKPNALCQNITIELDENGVISIVSSDIDNGSNDACGIASIIASNLDFSCANIGQNNLTLTVTDNNGNTQTCAAIVTVEDNINPGIICRPDINTNNDQGLCSAELILLPPFTSDNCSIASISRVPAGNTFDVGVTNVVWSISDAGGNVVTCEQTITVYDNELPQMVNSCNNLIDVTDDGLCSTKFNIDPGFTDNCGMVDVEGVGVFIYQAGVHNHVITATDVNGNVLTHEIQVIVHDGELPEITCPAGITVESPNNNPTEVDLGNASATDNCSIISITNDAPDEFALGTHTVTWTATDSYGNTATCTQNLMVNPAIWLTMPATIEAATQDSDGTQAVNWNAPIASTLCAACSETDMPDYIYLGDYFGHQYFLASADATTWADAQVLAEDINGHLVSINSAEENAFVTDVLAALPEDVEQVWTGLSDLNNEEYAWLNNDDITYLNFGSETLPTSDDENAVTLNIDGTWDIADENTNNFYIVERPCVQLEQTGPTIEVENNEGEIEEVLLVAGDEWPIGDYQVTYNVTDICGNFTVIGFQVFVQEVDAEYCETAGADHSIWIDEVMIGDYENASDNNEGYADFTDDLIDLTPAEDNDDETINLTLAAGGNDDEHLLYWRIWLDENNDGDFFDNELIFEGSSTETLETELTVPEIDVNNSRLRVSVSRYYSPEVCGDVLIGEIEDYNVRLRNYDETAARNCSTTIEHFGGERDGVASKLEWIINSTCHIDHYQVEYATDGENFVNIGSRQDETMINEPRSYTYTHDMPAKGFNYYRVLVVPTDSEPFYTDIVRLSYQSELDEVFLYPNPADEYIHVRLSQYVGKQVTLQVWDDLGRLKMEQQIDALEEPTIRLNTKNYGDGMFHLTVKAEGRRLISRNFAIHHLHGWQIND